MDSSTMNDTLLQDPIAAELDSDIASLQAQITSLEAQRSLRVSAILSSRTTNSILARLRTHKPSPNLLLPDSAVPADANPLITASAAQTTYNQESLYRACAGLTAFRVHDPDPNAVDGGNVLGIRFEASVGGRFLRPYYLLLNKPWPENQLLRVHRHTLPPAIPLAVLVERYLPHGKGALAMDGGATAGEGKRQDLRRLVRALRKEIVGYHNRTSVIKRLRKDLMLDEKASKKGKGKERIIEDVRAADAEAKHVSIAWADGRIGRAVVGEKGEIKKCVVIGEEGRERETERRIARGDLEGIGERIMEVVY